MSENTVEDHNGYSELLGATSGRESFIAPENSNSIEETKTDNKSTYSHHNMQNESTTLENSNRKSNNINYNQSDGCFNDGGGTSNTDGEDEHFSKEESTVLSSPPPLTKIRSLRSVSSSTVSQPLRTLQRLQAMLDDSDYASSAVTTASGVKRGHNKNHSKKGDLNPDNDPSNKLMKSQPSLSATCEAAENSWTSKDSAKYRRTRRAEKLRRDFEAHRLLQYRERQRDRIVQQERERKELEFLRRKQMEVIELQRRELEKRNLLQQRSICPEDSDFTDDTDIDGKGFELPDLPVYLSDSETDDFLEEPNGKQSSPQQSEINYTPRSIAMSSFQPLISQHPSKAQQMSYPYSHPTKTAYNRLQNEKQLSPLLQPERKNTIYQDHDNIQQSSLSQQYQNDHFPQFFPQHEIKREDLLNPTLWQIEEQYRHYELQYEAWVQAVRKGSYFPPPCPPLTTSLQPQNSERGKHAQRTSTRSIPFPQSFNANYLTTNAQFKQSTPFFSSYPSYQQQLDVRSQHFQTMETPSGIQKSTIRSQGFSDHSNRVMEEWPQEQYQSSQRSQGYSDIIHRQYHTYENNFPSQSMSDIVAANTQLSGDAASSLTSGKISFGSGSSSTVTPLVSPLSTRVIVPSIIEAPYHELNDESRSIIAGAGSKISFDSIQKISFSAIGVILLSYCAVSPRSLSFPEYNKFFIQNLSTVGLAAFVPFITLFCVYDGKYNNINSVIGTFHVSFTFGYTLAFITELVVTTALRLGIFLLWEPAIFSFTPEVPSIILPWVLREMQYKPKRISLFVCDFAASCVASPIIEEYLKLKVVQWTTCLPRNFKQDNKTHKGRKRRKKSITLPVIEDVDEVTNINCYVTQMMAASLGLKIFDSTRRILMYTKQADDYKHFYAFCRGIFPIHEMCGTISALLLARRDVLGVYTPLWKILGPAVLIHGMANFRGMKKPIFKWNSSTPWSEMQLYPWKNGNQVTLKQLVSKSYAKLVWFTILCRVFGSCVKNYYLIGRQAKKRITTYSGKMYAFSAKLETDEMLKRAN